MKIYKIPIDIKCGMKSHEFIKLTTNDNGSCTLEFTVLDNNEVYSLENSIVRLIAKTPSSASIQQDCTITNNIASITLKQGYFTEVGDHFAELQIYNATDQTLRLTLPRFTYCVRNSLMNDNTVVAEDDFSILQNVIINVKNANETATTALTNSTEALNNTSGFNQAVADVNALKEELTPSLSEIKNKVKVNGTSTNVNFMRNEYGNVSYIEANGETIRFSGRDDYSPMYKQTNLADISGKQNGYWGRDNVSQELSLKSAGGYFTIPIIELKKGIKYYISNFNPNFTWVMKKTDKKVTITRFDVLGVTAPYVYTATEDCYLYLTYTGVHDDIMVVENASEKPLKYLKYKQFRTVIENYKYDYDEQGNKVNTITVKKDGTGDFVSLAQAISVCSNSSINNQYKILIYDGVYNAISEMGGATYLNSLVSMSGAYAGYILSDYVHLVGMGKTRADVVLTANIEEYSGLGFSILDNAVTKLSTLNLYTNNNIENLTIIGQNCRYALHDESSNSYQNYIRNMKNVRIIHNGNDVKYTWRSANAVGAGSGSGAIYNYENCTFEAILPYSIHDNVAFTNGNNFIFNNCTFLAAQAHKIACRFVTVSLETEIITHDVSMNNCQFVGSVGQHEEAGGKGRKFYIHGGGNSVVPYIYINSSATAVTKHIAFNEETAIMFNGETYTITKGSLVRIQSSGIYKLTTSDKHLFYGIALEDIPPRTNGHVKTKGYVYANDIIISSLNVGDKIGISNGNLVVTTASDYIGVATDWNMILLK